MMILHVFQLRTRIECIGASRIVPDHAFQHECIGDNPCDVIKLFVNSGQAQVSCAVAIAAAMRWFFLLLKLDRLPRRGLVPTCDVGRACPSPAWTITRVCLLFLHFRMIPLDLSLRRRVPVHPLISICISLVKQIFLEFGLSPRSSRHETRNPSRFDYVPNFAPLSDTPQEIKWF